MRKPTRSLLAAFFLLAGCTSVSRLRRDLSSPEWQVRCAAAGRLQNVSVDQDTTPLLFMAMSDPSPRVRSRAGRALAAFLDGPTAAAVCDRARRAPDAVKLEVIQALAEPKTPDAATPFLSEMLADPSPDIRLAAARAFRGSHDAKKLAPLLGAWKREPQEKIRVAALVAACCPADSARKNTELIRCYTEMIEHGSTMLRNPGILRAAGDLRIRAAEPHLLAVISDPELRYVAIESLGEVRSQKAVPALLELLERNDSWVMNRQVCAALGRIRSHEAARRLAGYFVGSKPERDRDSWDRTLFITVAMSKIGGDEVFEAFASQITEKAKRDFALYGLRTMTGTRVVRRRNYWMYTWKGIQILWRKWWKEHKGEVAEKLDKEAEQES